MPEISHYRLAQIPGTEHLWDAEILEFQKSIAYAPADTTLLGAFADWCDEHGEPELATAARFLAKRPEIPLLRGSGKSPMWWVSNMPGALREPQVEPKIRCNQSPLGALADLYDRLDAARKALE